MSISNLLSEPFVPESLPRESDIRSLRSSISGGLSKGPENYRNLVLRYKEQHPNFYQNALEHLDEAYCLKEEDMAGYDYALYTLLSCVNSRAEFLRLLRTDDNLLPLLRRSVDRAAFKATGYEPAKASVDVLFEAVKANLSGNFCSMINFIQPHMVQARQLIDEAFEQDIPDKRYKAVMGMESKYGEFFRNLKENRHALTDEEMANVFQARNSAGSRFLTTYFDTAQFGIQNNCLKEAADDVARFADLAWEPFVDRMRLKATLPLERIHDIFLARRFKPENATFHPNGTMAFNAFLLSCMRSGDRVLATDEEYGEMLGKMKKHGIDVEQLPPFIDVAQYRGRIIEVLRASRFDYLLASETSRFGTVFPLAAIHEARKIASPHTKLIIDACQSAGRVEHDMTSCHPDVVLYSTNKGAEFGQGLGVVVLAKDFVVPGRRTGLEDTGMGDYPGTVYHEAMARTAHAMQSEGLTSLPQLSKYVLNPKVRSEAISDTAHKFVDLAAHISARHKQDPHDEDRIQIVRPYNKDKLAHVVEVKVHGVPRERLCELARPYGVHIAAYYYDAHDEESIRVAFHPFMGNESLKILGHVLDLACGM
ncbi:aminotransferase class V-fold PLP-dependent enzyme [Patescibacteria group bacterium]|nr:aminotransferase class V-fold PLP-dependent enzyme [Patescibacteria group bacterium]MBU1015640.1 aminotransferase class V-fold PLP-dependent enzyme [Patescibacteria group bacterium]MBU1684785.1 aminotransferase class V-fold PLP-dependent enzyme [Patescibacteria group bacterium]MBU1938219.1 aminotransferase class V-fold PLP-dependent enzyme [Patescibacteria group bacterium]